MWWYTDLIYRPDVQFTDQKKTAKKVTKNWNWPFLISQLLKIFNINTDHKSKMVWNKRHNLQARTVQFADQKKVWIGTNSTNRTVDHWQYWKLSNINSCLSFWTSLKSKVQLIQFTDQQKGTKKVTWAIYRPDEKKLKKVLESWNWTFHKWQY